MKKITAMGFIMALVLVLMSPIANAYRGWLNSEQYTHEPVIGGAGSGSFVTGIKGQYSDGRLHGYKIACKLYCRDCNCYTPAVADRLIYPRAEPIFQTTVQAPCKKCGRTILETITW